MATFKSLGLSGALEKKLADEGIFQPTPIQLSVIPAMLSGRDILGQAKTGSGKTLAFLLPIIAKIAENGFLPLQALIAAPTRELAGQIAAVAVLLIPEQAVAVLYGGHSMDAEVDSLKQRPSLIVGTPGRLCDHLNRGTLSCSTMRCLVLDEADEMLQMGFKDEIAALLTQFPKIGQRAFFSATLPRKMAQWAADALNNPVSIIIDRQTSDTAGIKQLLFETSDREKFNVLCTIIRQFHPYKAIIFCRTKRRAKKLHEQLLERRVPCELLHGDLPQSKREDVMSAFRGECGALLVATDIAARGLDIEDLTHVINYDIPHDEREYIHRVGRTGRAGAKGLAVTLAAPKDQKYVRLIERKIGCKFRRKTLK